MKVLQSPPLAVPWSSMPSTGPGTPEYRQELMNDPAIPPLTPPLTADHLNALDALALALYSASYHGRQVPTPENLLLELVQRDWMLVPIPQSTRHPPKKRKNPPPSDT